VVVYHPALEERKKERTHTQASASLGCWRGGGSEDGGGERQRIGIHHPCTDGSSRLGRSLLLPRALLLWGRNCRYLLPHLPFSLLYFLLGPVVVVVVVKKVGRI
jgi:hypothetical protein